ncbi:uncharacterized protein CLUP02_10915 [Colletotrichum lupini]|uniref:Uncharacterized protein n=1 Tax=Colletotrichum lupini TaxID=145971 RepID=A0A9Q8WJ05_9PEZI|nr:uncharacterized protein CLUP02_10915 [Colletotrichum lupini]UQC85418.1 hypothetical protein CLUP02_10915 [Colletotrichum lupini]
MAPTAKFQLSLTLRTLLGLWKGNRLRNPPPLSGSSAPPTRAATNCSLAVFVPMKYGVSRDPEASQASMELAGGAEPRECPPARVLSRLVVVAGSPLARRHSIRDGAPRPASPRLPGITDVPGSSWLELCQARFTCIGMIINYNHGIKKSSQSNTQGLNWKCRLQANLTVLLANCIRPELSKQKGNKGSDGAYRLFSTFKATKVSAYVGFLGVGREGSYLEKFCGGCDFICQVTWVGVMTQRASFQHHANAHRMRKFRLEAIGLELSSFEDVYPRCCGQNQHGSGFDVAKWLGVDIYSRSIFPRCYERSSSDPDSFSGSVNKRNFFTSLRVGPGVWNLMGYDCSKRLLSSRGGELFGFPVPSVDAVFCMNHLTSHVKPAWFIWPDSRDDLPRQSVRGKDSFWINRPVRDVALMDVSDRSGPATSLPPYMIACFACQWCNTFIHYRLQGRNLVDVGRSDPAPGSPSLTGCARRTLSGPCTPVLHRRGVMKLQKFLHGEFTLAVIPTYPGIADWT